MNFSFNAMMFLQVSWRTIIEIHKSAAMNH
jgi:hypothetical protein